MADGLSRSAANEGVPKGGNFQKICFCQVVALLHGTARTKVTIGHTSTLQDKSSPINDV